MIQLINISWGKLKSATGYHVYVQYAGKKFKKIATVSKNGRTKAMKEGTCTVFVYARNGYARKVKVEVY